MTEAGSGEPPSDEVPAEPLNIQRRAIARNSASAFLSLTVGAVTGVVVTRLLIHGFGITRYGLWSEALATTGYIALLDTGLGTAVVTRVAHAQQSDRDVSTIVSTAFGLYGVLAVLGAFVSLGVAIAAPALFHVHRFVRETQVVFFLLGLSQVVVLVATVASGAVQGTGRFAALAVRSTFLAVVVGAAQGMLALTWHDTRWPAVAAVAGSVATLVIAVWLAARSVSGFRMSWRYVDRSVARDLLRLGSRNAIVYLAGSIGFGSDVIVVGVILDAQAAAAYAVAVKGGQFLLAIATRTTDVLTPSYASLRARDEMDRAWSLYVRATRLSMMVALPAGVAVAAFAPGLLQVWLGSVPAHSDRVLAILCVTTILQMPGYNAFVLLTGTENVSRLARAAVVASVFNLALSVVLTGAIGVVGPAVGSLTAVLILDILLVPGMAAKLCGHRPWELAAALRPFVVPLALEAALIAALAAVVGLGRGAWAVAAATGCVIVFWIGCVVNRETRDLLQELASVLRRRVAAHS